MNYLNEFSLCEGRTILTAPVEVVDAINSLAALSGTVSVDITRIPETINIVADTVKQPLWKDRGFLAALLTCIGAIGGSLYMGWKTMQATRESNQNQERLARLKFEQDTEFKRLEIRERLASVISEVSQMALTFEIDFETCISMGYPNFPLNEGDPYNIRELRLQSIQRCLDSFAHLSLSYHKLLETLNSLALYVSTDDIATRRICDIFNWYVDKIKKLSSREESIYVYFRSNDDNKEPQHLELCTLTQEVLKKLREDEIKVIVPTAQTTSKNMNKNHCP